ncbi:MAG: PAS domain S-box protein, partial [Ferruginibacter sp.]
AEKEIQNPAKDLYEVECRMLRDDGTYAIINDRGQIIRNEEGIAVRLTGATQDITQRKEAELQVAKSEMRFRSLVQNSSDLISILDERGYYLYCSPALKKILGYEPESMIGKNVFAFIHPDDALFIKSNLNKNKQQSYDSLIPFRFKNENGEWQWMESKVINMTDNPEIKGYVFNTRDVTERVLAEEEIKKLSIIARETANAVIITDPEGKIVWANEAFTNISEYELEEVMGRKPGDFLQGTETNPAMVKFMHAEIEKLKAFECDILNYSKSGRKYWMRIQSQPQFDESGKLKGFFAIQTDVTREKEAEKILKASEERYRYLFQNSPASIFIWDLANFQILEVNKTAEKFYGYFREEFLTKTVFDITLTSEHLKIKQFASVALQKTSCKWEVLRTHLNKEGKEKFMSISSHCILLKGRPAILVLATDITDKTILENELENERHQKQQEITEAVISAQEQDRQQLGAELHDNINQILAGSLLYLGLAKNDLMIEHEYLNEAEKQISSAIYEIRKLSHSLIPPSLNESDLVAAIQHLISDTENSSSIKVSLYVKGFDENNMSDKLKLNIYRVIQEQFNNIHKHAEAQKVIISLEKENGKTVLSIKDDGVGFDVDQKANGVGLMNIKTRVSLFNGSMLIISSPGNGCELKAVFE